MDELEDAKKLVSDVIGMAIEECLYSEEFEEDVEKIVEAWNVILNKLEK